MIVPSTHRPETVVGANLRATRLAAATAVSIALLARRAGCSPALVSRIEAGTVAPSLATLVAIADALGVHPGELADARAPVRRAAAAIAAARTATLMGRAPDFALVERASEDPSTPAAWRARAFAALALSAPPRDGTCLIERADAALADSGAPTGDWAHALARIEVAWAAGEVAWVAGNVASAARRWGGGLAVAMPFDDIEAQWARGTIARGLARIAPGTRAARNVLGVAIEALAPIADPAAVATRLCLARSREPLVDAALALAVVASAQIALADARARMESPITGAPGTSRSDPSLGRHLR